MTSIGGRDMERRRYDDKWSLDKRIPLALILAMFAQFGSAIWWISDFNSRVLSLEKFQEQSGELTSINETDLSNIKERVLRLEIYLTNIDSKLLDIKNILSEHHNKK